MPILTYHVIAPWSVARAYALRALDVSPMLFAAQLRALRAAGWRTITAARLWLDLADAQRPVRKSLVIAIDDGHTDGYTYALPLLRQFGDVATYYVVAGRVGRFDTLSWPQIAALQADGMEIGDHTLNHVPLGSASPSEVAFEIRAAQQLLDEHLGAPPTTFAYPFGSYDRSVETAVRNAGLCLALTTSFGAYETLAVRFDIPRIHIPADLSPRGLLSKIARFG